MASPELDRAIDRAVVALVAAIADPARETESFRAFLEAVRIHAGRPLAEAFARDDLLAVNRMITARLGDHMGEVCRSNLPFEAAESSDQKIADVVCCVVNEFSARL
jgi:hypothetical protein